MRVLLDEKPYECPASTIAEAISHAAAAARTRGRVIVEAVVDGDAWNETQLASAELGTGTAGEIRLVSAGLAPLVDQTLVDASEALAEADELQREAAGLVQADRAREAMARLEQALGIWHAVQQALVTCARAAAIDLEHLRVGDEPLSVRIERFGTLLATLREAVDHDDPVGLADALLYDLPEVVLEWREALEAMRGAAEALTDAGPATETGEPRSTPPRPLGLR